MEYIPGHIRAYTLWLMIVLSAVAYFRTDSLSAPLGVFLMILGGFLGDQATHLAQADHSGMPPTWIERQQQSHRWLFVIGGIGLAVFGLILVLPEAV